jgi:SpoIIAA-like
MLGEVKIGTKEALMIELLEGFPDSIVAVSCRGQVTKKDYDTVLVPAVDKALKAHEKVRLYYEAGPGFAGIDAAAAWEDFKVGMGHFSRWKRVAVVTDVDWITQTIRIFGFLMPGDMRVFPTAEAAQARSWIGST